MDAVASSLRAYVDHWVTDAGRARVKNLVAFRHAQRKKRSPADCRL